MKDKIIISKCTHPLPMPEFDYCAYWDGLETGNQGWGSSPDLACADMLANYEQLIIEIYRALNSFNIGLTVDE
ncbi:MAG: hypothetical protein EBZ49_03690 [Proteobacteria bacterium]|nr:hypothetical protein [Pseudomonadota bacterium]